MTALTTALEEIVDALKQPIDAKERQKLVQKAEEILDNTLVILQDLRAMIPDDGKTPASRIAATTLDLMIDMVKEIIRILECSLSLILQINNDNMIRRDSYLQEIITKDEFKEI